MTASPAPAPQKTEKGTNYYVLRRDTSEDGKDGWLTLGTTIRATSAEAAIREVATALEIDTEYLAIPERSYKPYKVTVETTKTVRLG